MKAINCLLLILCCSSTLCFATEKANLTRELRNELKTYQPDGRLKSSEELMNTLTKVLAKPELISNVCANQPTRQEKEYCESSVFSFVNEADGLHNSLEILIPIIKECHGDKTCINDKAGNLFSIMTADIAQLTLYLKYAAN